MDFVLIQNLKNKRKEIALREGKELFMILSNATIDAMADALPQTKEELIQIKGWGEKKIKMYGEAFLEILKMSSDQANVSDDAGQKRPKRIAIQIGQEVAVSSNKNLSAELENADEHNVIEKVSEIQISIVSVSEFLQSINLEFAKIGLVKIKGEIDDVQIRSGYSFFTLKESIGGFSSEGVLACFVSWKHFETLQHLLQNGMEVVVSGYPRIYLKNGSFHLEVSNIEPIGEGALQKAFEALKRKLTEKGYFDLSRKRPIPDFIRKIGLVTSMNGAVIEDFKKNIGSCGFLVECLDVRVEGDFSEENIIRAIRYFNDYKSDCDVLVLIRGGGSLQSLKSFNSESVADAIYFSRIPIITGIGHEKDETIAGLVSDLNCSTPTAVANFLKAQYETLQMSLETHSRNLVQSLNGRFSENKNALEYDSNYLVIAFEKLLRSQNVHVNTLYEKLRYGFQNIFISFQNFEKIFVQSVAELQSKIFKSGFQVEMQQEKIVNLYLQKIQVQKQSLDLLQEKLSGLNPEAILKRGYSLTFDQNGKIIKDAEKLLPGESITSQFFKGSTVSEIKKIKQ